MRDEQRPAFVDDLLQDVRVGARAIRRSPAFALLAVLTLALAIGANAAVFGILDAVRLRPLPVEHPDRLVQLIVVHEHGWQTNIDYDVYARLRGPHRSLDGLCAYWPATAVVAAGDGADTSATPIQAVSGNYFQLLGFRPRTGRALADRDDRPDSAPVAVVSGHFWRSRLGSDPNVLDKRVIVDGVPFVIVGLMPDDFFGADLGTPPEVIVPFAKVPEIGKRAVQIMGRLAAAGTVEGTRAELQAPFRAYLASLAPMLARWSERDRRAQLSQRLDLRPAANGMGDTRLRLTSPLLVLFSLSALVLIAGCANLCGLLVARLAGRAREFAIRLSLGASRRRLVTQLMAEASLIAGVGGLAGLVLGRWAHAAVLSLFAPDTAAIAVPYRADLHVLAFTAGLTALSGLLVGFLPASRAAHGNLYQLSRGGSGTAGRPGRERTVRLALVSQVAVSVVLVVGAGLFVRTVHELAAADPGFDRGSTVLVNIDTSRAQQSRDAGQLEERLLGTVSGVPHVRSAALAGNEVFAGGTWTKAIWVQGRRYAPTEDQSCRFNLTSPGFFRAVGIPLLLGRDFTERDRPGAPLVAIVNQAMAEKYFPHESPIGKRFGDSGPGSSGNYEIVGVTGNSKTQSLREATAPSFYQPLAQAGFELRELVLHVQTAGEAPAVGGEIRRQLRRLDPRLLATRITTLSEHMDATVRQERMMALVGSAFGMMALLLVCIGIFAAASGEAARRAGEMGVRMALGARRSQIGGRMLGQTLALVAGGLAVGLPAALGVGRLLRTMLFGVAPSDLPTMAGACGLVIVVATLAAVLPAARAASVDPAKILRHE